ncbi:MAG: tetratricopeptide repeat protein [Candidatus Solibacter usitatus]|nr:tetratricopeptide repeat protein [Candidatus Solibacter usitatus]
MIAALTCLLAISRLLPAAEPAAMDSNAALFSVLAAINAAGYDADLQSAANHPLRQAVRKAIAAKEIPSLAAIKRFYRERKQETDTRTLSLFISYALCVEGPPNFKFRLRKNDLPPEVLAMEGFSELMQQFHKEAGIDAMWKQVQPAYEPVFAAHHEPVSRAVLEANGYFRNPTSGYQDRRFQIYVDLLGAPRQVHTRSYGAETFVVVTPAPEPMIDDIRHAYLQYLTGPLVLRQKETVDTKKGLGDFAQPAPLPEVYKQDFLLLLEKSLIKAIETRLLTGPGSIARRQQMVDRAMAEGYILTAYFSEALPAYENQEQSLRFYIPDMIKNIDLRKEDKRIEKIQFASSAAERKVRVAPVKPEEPSVSEKMLSDAEALYDRKQYDQAKEQYFGILKQIDVSASHAKSYYGLARIAIIQKDPELGERLFQKALDLNPDPATKAWCLVYLGRLADVLGETAKAGEQYKLALAIEGASKLARDTATKGLNGDFRKK